MKAKTRWGGPTPPPKEAMASAIEQLSDRDKSALLYIAEQGGKAMPSTQDMALALQSLGSVVGSRSGDLVVQHRGGITDQHMIGNGVFEITPWGQQVAEELRKTLVPHHAADGTIKHYCSQEYCPDIHGPKQ